MSLFAAIGLHCCLWPNATRFYKSQIPSTAETSGYTGLIISTVNLNLTLKNLEDNVLWHFPIGFDLKRKNMTICHLAKFLFFLYSGCQIAYFSWNGFFSEKFGNNFFKRFWSSESNAIIYFALKLIHDLVRSPFRSKVKIEVFAAICQLHKLCFWIYISIIVMKYVYSTVAWAKIPYKSQYINIIVIYKFLYRLMKSCILHFLPQLYKKKTSSGTWTQFST